MAPSHGIPGQLVLATAGALALWFAPAFLAPSSDGRRLIGGGRSELRTPGSSAAAPKARPVTATAAAIEEDGSAFGGACRAAAILAFVCASARSSTSRRRLSAVTRFSSPLMQKNRFRVQAYFCQWGPMPSITHKTDRLWNPRRAADPASIWKRRMIEKQRVRYHFNVRNYQMENYATRAFRQTVEYKADYFLQILESRMDNVIWRMGVGKNMYHARWLVRRGHFQYTRASWQPNRDGSVHWQTSCWPSLEMKIGDKIRVNPGTPGKYSYLDTCSESMKQLGEVKVPSHLFWDREKMEGEYLDICHHSEVGIPINGELFAGCFTGMPIRQICRARVRRWRNHPGPSTQPIKRPSSCNKVRETPENMRNMKMGIGYVRTGRRAPPCIWGRKHPLNSPYSSDQSGLIKKSTYNV